MSAQTWTLDVPDRERLIQAAFDGKSGYSVAQATVLGTQVVSRGLPLISVISPNRVLCSPLKSTLPLRSQEERLLQVFQLPRRRCAPDGERRGHPRREHRERFIRSVVTELVRVQHEFLGPCGLGACGFVMRWQESVIDDWQKGACSRSRPDMQYNEGARITVSWRHPDKLCCMRAWLLTHVSFFARIGGTICAERTAIVKAVVSPSRKHHPRETISDG